MIYVLQVMTGRESEVITFMEALVDKEYYNDVYYPTRKMQKKFKGQWNEVTEKLIPGYIFVESDEPVKLYQQLKRVPRLTKLLGRDPDEKEIQRLTERDERWLRKLMGVREGQKNQDPHLRGEVGLTLVSIDDDNVVHILEGPLKGVEGHILKYNLHKRFAAVEMDFMGQKTVLHMGIMIAEKKGE